MSSMNVHKTTLASLMAVGLAVPVLAQEGEHASEEDFVPRARSYSPFLDQHFPNRVFWGDTHLVRSAGRSGGGALPEQPLPGWAVALRGLPNQDLARRLRLGEPAVVGRIHEDSFRIDPRCLLDAEIPLLLSALKAALQDLAPASQAAPSPSNPDRKSS